MKRKFIPSEWKNKPEKVYRNFKPHLPEPGKGYIGPGGPVEPEPGKGYISPGGPVEPKKNYRNFYIPPGLSAAHILPKQAHNDIPPGYAKKTSWDLIKGRPPSPFIQGGPWEKVSPIDLKPPQTYTKPTWGGPWEKVSPIDFKPPRVYTGSTRLPAGGPHEVISPIDFKPPQAYTKPGWFVADDNVVPFGQEEPPTYWRQPILPGTAQSTDGRISGIPPKTIPVPPGNPPIDQNRIFSPATIGKYGSKKKGKKSKSTKKVKKSPQFWGI